MRNKIEEILDKGQGEDQRREKRGWNEVCRRRKREVREELRKWRNGTRIKEEDGRKKRKYNERCKENKREEAQK